MHRPLRSLDTPKSPHGNILPEAAVPPATRNKDIIHHPQLPRVEAQGKGQLRGVSSVVESQARLARAC
eukprot:5442828-Heterocapsa_arctica.AAC.1